MTISLGLLILAAWGGAVVTSLLAIRFWNEWLATARRIKRTCLARVLASRAWTEWAGRAREVRSTYLELIFAGRIWTDMSERARQMKWVDLMSRSR